MVGEEFDEVPLSSLSLDPLNPRLPLDRNWAAESEEQLLREFVRRYNLIELARSIADKGFQPRHAEALLVVEDPPDSKRYVTIEGNRRLATLMLLKSPDSRKAVLVRGAEWEELAASEKLQGIEQAVPVIVYPNRDALSDYLGFRHITGPRPWRPEAKARFVATLLSNRETIGEVAKRIGSNQRTVRRLAEAHAIYRQAEGEGFPMDEVEAAFGVFYNALDRRGIRDFLELGPQKEIDSLPVRPVSDSAIDHLEELIVFLYGAPETDLEKVISESRELNKLEKVLAHPRALANLRLHRDLDRAWHLSGGGREELVTLLDDAYRALARVNGQAYEYADDEELRDEVRRVNDLVTDMAGRYGIHSP
ncbi:MAG: hypothetical protein OXK79_11840 [Chloroflexota bacterium]|nr:hypothetical protein [Chloroflexota bacterium]